MVLSRFWYLALASALAFAIAATLLGQASFNRQYDHALGDQLRRDRFEIELLMRMDARARIDAIGPIAAHQDVRNALRTSSGRRDRRAVDGDTRTRLGERLRALNGQLEEMAGDILFAVDDEGYIIAQLGAADPPAGAGLGAFPLVERALAGYLRDDVWAYNDGVFRMAARPVIDGGLYVGAIVHGKRLDDEFARRLAERIDGATVAFFVRDRAIGSHMPQAEGAARADDISAKLAEALAVPALREGGRTEPIDLGGGTSRAVYSLVTGSAAHGDAGYAVARPRKILAGPLALFDEVANEDVAALPWPIVGGAGFGAFLFGMIFLWLERDRPFGKLRRASAALAKREIQRFDIASHGGGYRKVAEAVNQAMDAAVEAAGADPRRKAANLDEILGPSPEGEKPPAFFGFAQTPGDPGSIPPPPGPAAGGGPKPAAAGPVGTIRGPGAPPMPGPPGPPPPVARPGGPPAGPPPGPAPRPPAPSAYKPPSPAGPPPGTPTVMGVGPSGGAKPDWSKGTLVGVGDEGGEGSGPMQAPRAGHEETFEDDEVATTVAPVPRELLSASESGLSHADDEERHFREVYDAFVETKKQCGELFSGLTYQKFVQTLKKNREQIVSRHAASKVRFTVYVKAGKAALKATPVK